MDCIPVNPDHVESRAVLLAKYEGLMAAKRAPEQRRRAAAKPPRAADVRYAFAAIGGASRVPTSRSIASTCRISAAICAAIASCCCSSSAMRVSSSPLATWIRLTLSSRRRSWRWCSRTCDSSGDITARSHTSTSRFAMS